MSKIKTIVVMFCVLLAVSVMTSFGAGSFNWYTDANVEDAILYPSDGQAGVGDTSLEGITGASDWYAMVYDTDLFDVDTFDIGDYASREDARDHIMASELHGGQYVDTVTSGGTFYSYIDQGGIDGTDVSEKTVGTLVFDAADPRTTSPADLLFAYSTQTTTMPNMFGDPPPTEDYNAGVVGFNGAEWQAVPEPAVTLFALLGVGTIFYRRRRMRNQ